MTTNNSKTKTIFLAAFSISILLGFGTLHTTYADHPLDIYGVWSNGIGTDVCYDSDELDDVSIGGTWNHSDDIEDELDDARDEWNAQSASFALWWDTSCQSSDQWVGSANLGLFGDLAVTYITDTGDYVTDTDTDFNTQKQFEIESDTCDWWDWDIEWVANHEFGHWVSFDHSTATNPTHSVMISHCVAGWENVQTDDADDLEDLYP